MVESADFDDATANAVAIGSTNLVGTGLARESGGNLDTHTGLLRGTAAGALIANIGATIGQEVAAQIATGSAAGTPGGAPLLHGARQVFSVTGQVIAPASTYTPANILFTRPGYLIRILANMGAGLAATPYGKADLVWEVAAQGAAACWEDVWYFYGGNNNNFRTNGRGVVQGDTLSLRVTNGDAVNSMTVSINIWETTHAPARSDWRSADAQPSATASKASNVGAANALADINQSIPAVSVKTYNLPLYAGQVNLWLNQNTAAGSTVLINPVGGYDFPQGEPIIEIDWTKVQNTYEGIILPRAPCSIVANNLGAGAQTLLATLTCLEYAS